MPSNASKQDVNANPSRMEKIDWPTVAKTMNLNVPAARMRFRRLEEKIQTAMNEKAGAVADADTDVHMAGTSADGDGAGAGAGDTGKAGKVTKPRGNKRKRTAKETGGGD